MNGWLHTAATFRQPPAQPGWGWQHQQPANGAYPHRDLPPPWGHQDGQLDLGLQSLTEAPELVNARLVLQRGERELLGHQADLQAKLQNENAARHERANALRAFEQASSYLQHLVSSMARDNISGMCHEVLEHWSRVPLQRALPATGIVPTKFVAPGSLVPK